MSDLKGQWAIILGASSGFGAATAIELARAGVNIAGVHLDRRQGMANVEKLVDEIRATGAQAEFYNINAADAEKREETLDSIAGHVSKGPGTVRVLLHSIAFGTTGVSFVPREGASVMNQKQLEMTLDTMANSLVYWVQGMVTRSLVGKGTRVYGMTSSGDARVIRGYGAVSAAKAVLESHLRQLAAELAPLGASANAIRAGVTNTPALQKIPGGDALLEFAQRANPSGRVTTPEDVARCIVALSRDGTEWMTGNVIGVDGGEDIVIV